MTQDPGPSEVEILAAYVAARMGPFQTAGQQGTAYTRAFTYIQTQFRQGEDISAKSLAAALGISKQIARELTETNDESKLLETRDAVRWYLSGGADFLAGVSDGNKASAAPGPGPWDRMAFVLQFMGAKGSHAQLIEAAQSNYKGLSGANIWAWEDRPSDALKKIGAAGLASLAGLNGSEDMDNEGSLRLRLKDAEALTAPGADLHDLWQNYWRGIQTAKSETNKQAATAMITDPVRTFTVNGLKIPAFLNPIKGDMVG